MRYSQVDNPRNGRRVDVVKNVSANVEGCVKRDLWSFRF